VEAPKIEEAKEKVKKDFVPDENFTWDLDLESLSKGKKKKKPKTLIGAAVIT
jgi:hypothetical protein